jgi:hypothetical protein
MSRLVFRCPNTANFVDAGVDTDSRSLSAAQGDAMKVYCPYCKDHHELPIREAILEDDPATS